MATRTSKLILSLVDRVTAPSRGVSRAIGGLQDRIHQNNRRMSEMRGQFLGVAGAGILLARGLASPVMAAANFEAAMNKVKAVSGATGDQFATMKAQAKDLGKTTQFSASQAAEAQSFLAMAGLKTNQILEAMPGTLQLAAAAQMDLGSAANVVTNIMSGYGKKASELGHVNDVLVKTFISANTDLRQLGEAMKYAGPVAAAAGVEFEETSAALGLMGNAGIQATMAGTSLKGAISRILAPTKKMRVAMKAAGLSFTDSHGKLKPLVDIVKELEPHAEDAGLFMELFGQRAGPAMAVLASQGSEALKELTGELKNSGGTAQRISDVQMSGFAGVMKTIASVTESVRIAIGDALIPALTKLAAVAKPILDNLATYADKYPKLTAALFGVSAGLVAFRIAAFAAQFAFLWMKGAAMMVALGNLKALRLAINGAKLAFLPFGAAVRSARTAMVGFTAVAAIAGKGEAFKQLGLSMIGLLNPLRMVTGAMRLLKLAVIGTGIGAILVGIAAAGTAIYNNWAGIKQMFAGIGEGLRSAFPGAGAMIDTVSSAISKLAGLFGNITGPIDASSEAWRAFGVSIGESIGGAINTVAALPGKIIALIQPMLDFFANLTIPAPSFGLVIDAFNGLLSVIQTVVGGIESAVGKAVGAISRLGAAQANVGASNANALKPIMPGDLNAGSLNSAIAGARAAGGPIAGGRTYLVGEEGPELITPNRGGFVHNAKDTAGMMSGGSASGGSAPARGGRAGVSVTMHNAFTVNAASKMDTRSMIDDMIFELRQRTQAELDGLNADFN